ncbi:ABZJ_00895 family protein [Litorimonas sp. RW-G-Af-16]|uniref:ABZJ_00895 family protein n=1 Tax=Litorimonas sp. RW-G-Af-16 TaxID=3241168 RepID=UPI00390C8C52
MIKHYKNAQGYAWLFYALYMISLVIALIAMGLLGGYFGVQNPIVMGLVALIPPIVSTHLAAGRFLSIEQRSPTSSEVISIAFRGFLLATALPLIILIAGAAIEFFIDKEVMLKLFMGVGPVVGYVGLTSYLMLVLSFGPIAYFRQQNRQRIVDDHAAIR